MVVVGAVVGRQQGRQTEFVLQLQNLELNILQINFLYKIYNEHNEQQQQQNSLAIVFDLPPDFHLLLLSPKSRLIFSPQVTAVNRFLFRNKHNFR